MTYIAEIIKQRQFNSPAIARLLGQKRIDGLWLLVTPKEIEVNSRDLHLKQLILLELDNDLTPLTITDSSAALVNCLRDWSLRLTRFNSQNAEIELSKESLEYQAVKFYQREENLKRREEMQRQQEQKLQSLVEKAEKKLAAAEAQNDALKLAWEHLYGKEQQLKGDL